MTGDTVYCNLHKRVDCTLCDECAHETADHLNGHEARDRGDATQAAFIFGNATCWAENICSSCNAELYAVADRLGLTAAMR